LIGPTLIVTALGIRDLLRLRRMDTQAFQKWWPWIHLAEPETGQQKYLPKRQEQKTIWCIYWLEENHLCRFRLRFGISRLGTVGQISWDGHEIRVEGRISPLVVATPLIIAVWMGILMGAAYLMTGTDRNPRTLLVAVGGVGAVTFVVVAVVYLAFALLERVYFKKA
jgi:hypothetical protein